MTLYCEVESPVGPLLLLAEGDFLSGLYMKRAKYAPAIERTWQVNSAAPIFQRTRAELEAYFAGKSSTFAVPLAPVGTAFQKEVWRALVRIPFGTTTTYGELARRLGRPTHARAVGAANGRNPISILVPCHRVVGSDGALVGYAGGEARKRWLLDHERGHLGEKTSRTRF